jgi:HEAT repeat protein
MPALPIARTSASGARGPAALSGLIAIALVASGGRSVRAASLLPQDRDPVRSAGAAPSPGSREELLEPLGHLDPARRAEAFRALAAEGEPAVRLALDSSCTVSPWARRLRIELFAAHPVPDLLPRLLPRAADPAAEVRRALAEALGARELFAAPSERERALGALLDDPEPEVRAAALRALAAIDRPEAAEELVRAQRGGSRVARVELLRALASLRSARPLLLDLRRSLAPGDREARLELAYAIGGAAVHARGARRLDELVDVIAADLGAADADLRAGGEFALRSLDAELRAALAWEELEGALLRLARLAPHRSAPLQRAAVLRAFDPLGRWPRGAEELVAGWRRRWPDERTTEGREALFRGALALGLGELLRGDHAAAMAHFGACASAIEVALRRSPSDRWGGWPLESGLVESSEEEDPLEIDPELWDEEIARRGLERRRPAHHFDLVQRELLREAARARLLVALAACLAPSAAVDPEAEVGAAFELLLEGYMLSVAIEGFSFRVRERLPTFGENLDLVFEGETGLYELLYALARRGRTAELPAALRRFAAAIEAQGAWAAREVAAPRGFEEEPEVLDIESFVRFRRRNPSRFRMVWAQLLLDSCGDPDAARAVYEEAIRGYGLATRDWPWAARLEAQAVQGLASCHMARRDPDAVEQALARGLARLEELERSLVRADGPGAGDWLRPDLAALHVSRAVNENVLRGRPDLGLRHIRRALELDPSDFNWVLAACYEARAGNAAEARAILSRVPPQPSMAYNRGCTLALLGAADEAFVWLATDLRENHLSEASQRQQARWAWGDPDLRGLLADPRFEALYGPEPR